VKKETFSIATVDVSCFDPPIAYCFPGQLVPLPVTRARRRLAVALRHLSPVVHSRVRKRHRPRSGRGRQRVPRAFSRSTPTAGHARIRRFRAGLHAARRQQRTPAEARRCSDAVCGRPAARRHATALGCRGLRRRRPRSDRDLRLHRVREVLAAVRHRHDRLLRRGHPAARQYARRLPAGSGSRRRSALQSAIG